MAWPDLGSNFWDHRGRYRMIPIQSLYITTKGMHSNPIHGEVFSIQYYVIKFVSDLRQVRGFLRVLRFSPPLGKPWYKWFVAWSHAISHLSRWLLYGSLRAINLQPRFLFDFNRLIILFINFTKLFWLILTELLFYI